MAADGSPGDVNPIDRWWMWGVGCGLGDGLLPDELVEVVRHKVVVPLAGCIEVLGVRAWEVRNADVGSLTDEVLRVRDTTYGSIEGRTTIAGIDENRFVEVLTQWLKHEDTQIAKVFEDGLVIGIGRVKRVVDTKRRGLLTLNQFSK